VFAYSSAGVDVPEKTTVSDVHGYGLVFVFTTRSQTLPLHRNSLAPAVGVDPETYTGVAVSELPTGAAWLGVTNVVAHNRKAADAANRDLTMELPRA
jgi:hypothetical protein